MWGWSDERFCCPPIDGKGCSCCPPWEVPERAQKELRGEWRFIDLVPVADIEWRALAINVFKPPIAVPLFVLVVQYASITESSSESLSLVSTVREGHWDHKMYYADLSPRLRNSLALDFFIVIKRFNVRLGPLSVPDVDISLIPSPLPDDGIGEPMRFVLVDVDGWPLVMPCWRSRNGAWGRRQPFDQPGSGRVLFGVGERTGVFRLTLLIFIDAGLLPVPMSDEAD